MSVFFAPYGESHVSEREVYTFSCKIVVFISFF